MSEEDVKTNPAPEKAEGGDHLQVKVVGADGSEVFFKIKNKTPLSKLMKAYCQRQGVDSEQVRFLYDGDRILPTTTPDDLGMEEGDIIDAMVQQIGGY